MSGASGFAASPAEVADEKLHIVALQHHRRRPREHANSHSRPNAIETGSPLEEGEDIVASALAAESGQEVDISASQRMLAACSGSLLTSLLVTPLDVVRVRLQSQVHESAPLISNSHSQMSIFPTSASQLRAHRFPLTPLEFQSTAALSAPELGVTACCREVFWINNTNELCIASPITSATESCVVEETSRRRFQGTWEGLVKIARYEGIASLWRGLSPTLLMSVPANVIYFTGYDSLRTNPSSPFASLGPTWAPLLAGSSARAIAATAISPIELFKTRLQASSAHPYSTGSSGLFRDTLFGVRDMVRQQGVTSLWRGLSLTLWRDVPFSGVYWLGYEAVKEALQSEREKEWHFARLHGGSTVHQSVDDLHGHATFMDSFIAGAISGCVASFLTTPFDVGKTRRQIAMHREEAGIKAGSMPRVLHRIWRDEGLPGLWKGFVPRMLKVAPACAIMISSYELGKKAARKMNERRESGEL
ncbi:Carrier protein, mitochondrial [Rhizina undulata]